MAFSHEIYYADQSKWGEDDFYYLNRYLNRLFLRSQKRSEEIELLDLSKMTIETKTLMKVILQFQEKNDFFEMDNLAELKSIGPLKNRLNLVKNPRGVHALYTNYNIGW